MRVDGTPWFVVVFAHVAYPFETYEEAKRSAVLGAQRGGEVLPIVYEWADFPATRVDGGRR
jgi:hypothetical protein